MKPVKLKLDGKTFENRNLPPAVLKAKKEIDAFPDGEIFTTRRTCELLNISDRTLDRIPNAFPEVTDLWKGKRIFGNPRAIAQYRKEVGL